MNQYRYLVKNIGVLTISSFATNILSFFLLPLYTSILSTEEYGIFDIYSTSISLLIPLFTLCTANAIVIYLLDNDSVKEEIVAIGVKYLCISFLLLIVVYTINITFNLLPVLNEYKVLFILLYLSTSINQFFNNIARGFEKMVSISIASLISGGLTIGLNVVFLVGFEWGLKGYFGATIWGLTLSNFFYFFYLKFWKYLRYVKCNKKIELEICKYGCGLLVNTISWWITLSSDRYVVLYMCGIGANGLISVANKIPTVMRTFQNLFENAWILSVAKNYNQSDKDSFFINIYNYYNLFMILITSLVIAFVRFLALVLFKGEFFEAWHLVPFYMMAALFNAGAGVLGGIFTAEKKIRVISITTALGAGINIILNILLVVLWGVIGIAIATMVANGIVLVVRIFYVKKMMDFRLSTIRDIAMYGLLLGQIFVQLICDPWISYASQACMIGALLLLYRMEIKQAILKIRR